MTLGRQVAIIAVGLGTTILLARILGPSGNGEYAVAMLLPTMLATFLNLGIAPANVYFIGREDVSVRTAVDATMLLWALLCCIGAVIMSVIISIAHDRWFHGVPILFLWLAAAVFPLTMLRGLIAGILQGLEDFSRYNKMMLAAPVATLALVIVTVWVLDLGVAGAIIASAVGSASGLSAAFIALRPRMKGARDGVARYCRRCLSYGWKAHLSNILAFFNYRADVFLLNYFLSPAAAGIYMIAVKVAEQLWLFSGAVSTVLLPRLSALHRHEDRRKLLTPLVARWITLLSCVGAIGLLAFGGPLVRVLFGREYESAGPALLWLLPGIVLGGSARILANDIASRGRPDINLLISAVVVVANIAGNILLIPRYGIVGAAMATTLSYGLNSIVKVIVYSRMSGNRWMDSVLPTAQDWHMLQGSAKSWLAAKRASS